MTRTTGAIPLWVQIVLAFCVTLLLGLGAGWIIQTAEKNVPERRDVDTSLSQVVERAAPRDLSRPPADRGRL